MPFAPAAPRGLAPGAALASAGLAAAALAGGLAGGGRTKVGQDLFFQATQLRGSTRWRQALVPAPVAQCQAAS